MSEVLFNGHDQVLLVTILLSAILIVQLMLAKNRTNLFRVSFVGFFLCCAAISLDLLVNFGEAFHAWVLENAPNLIFVFEFGAWLHAPFGFLMVASCLDKNFRFKPVYWLLFLPFFMYGLHQLILYHSLPTAVKIDLQQSKYLINQSISLFFVQLAREMFRVVLAVMAINVLLCYRSRINTPESPGWLEMICVACLIYSLMGCVVAGLLMLQSQWKAIMPVGYWGLAQNYFLAATLLTLSIKIYDGAVKQREYSAIDLGAKKDATININQNYVNLIEELVGNQKKYTDPSLSLERLAADVGISPRTLSTVINSHYQCSFIEFINRYRLDEAKRLLVSDKNKAVLDIMYDSGFNSKATFNSMFKRMEGLTPSQYRRQKTEIVISAS